MSATGPRRVRQVSGGPGPSRRAPFGRNLLEGVDRGILAPVTSAVALLLVGIISFGLLGGPVPDLASWIPQLGGSSSSAPPQVAGRTPDPVKPFPVTGTQNSPAVPHVRGTILFVKAGNVWSVSGDDNLQQVSRTGHDSSPTWSPDGRTIYFLETREQRAIFPYADPGTTVTNDSPYTLDYPVLSSMHADGTGRAEIQSGLYSFGPGNKYTYFYWLLQPAVSPDGRTFALISDGPDPQKSDTVLATMPVTGTKPPAPAPLAEESPIGHNDPAWSPDGTSIAYTYNHREGSLGQPRIAVYNVKTGQAKFLTKFGFSQPSYSPNGKFMAAVLNTNHGRDIVIISASSGAVLLQATSDGHSFAPTWSPAGDQIAFLRANGQTIDLVVMTLKSLGSRVSVSKLEYLTSQSALDGTSRPAWYIPPDQMPTPAPTAPPTTAPSIAPSGDSGASPGP